MSSFFHNNEKYYSLKACLMQAKKKIIAIGWGSSLVFLLQCGMVMMCMLWQVTQQI
jgi:hypothetical protein